MTHPEPLPGGRPIEELRDSGLLWLINRVALHPHGFALALDVDDDGRVRSWRLLGDGTEPWQFPEDTDREAFTRAMATLGAARGAPDVHPNR